MSTTVKDLHSTAISDRDFARLSGFIHSEFGIKMPEAKKSFLRQGSEGG